MQNQINSKIERDRTNQKEKIWKEESIPRQGQYNKPKMWLFLSCISPVLRNFAYHYINNIRLAYISDIPLLKRIRKKTATNLNK